MTRMLWKFLVSGLLIALMAGCSLFSSDEGTGSDLDTESVSNEMVLDSEDEMLEESSDLIDDLQAEAAYDFGAEEDGSSDQTGDSSGDEFSEEEFADEPAAGEFASEDFSDDDFGKIEDEFSEEEFADEPAAGEFASEDFSDDDFGKFEDEFAVADMEVSASDDAAVDQQLVEDELSEFDNSGAIGEDEFALEGEPVIDEPVDALIVDAPQDGGMLGNQVTNLAYKSFENGGTVVIETSSPAGYQKIVDPELNQVIIEVADVFLPERFKRPYVTKDFKQDIATINAYADSNGAARFVIQLKRPIEPIVQTQGNSILVMTAGAFPMQQASADAAADPGPAEQPLDDLVAENQMQIQTKGASGQGVTEMATEEVISNAGGVAGATGLGVTGNGQMTGPDQLALSFGGVEKSGLRLGDGNFVGEKINLEYVDTEVRSIIEVVAELSGVNLIMDEEVEGKTSIRLRNVPWDQALLVLLRSQGLGYVKQGSVLRIAKQDTLSKEAQAVSAQIKSEKQAKLLSGGLKVKYIPVSYAKVSELASKLKEFLSKDGKVASDDRTSSLVITDYGEYIDRVADLVKALDTAPMQVEIESKLVEARENFIRESGINWNISGNPFPFGDQTATIGGGLNLPGGGDNGLSLDLNVGTFDIFGDLQAALSLFETSDKIKILSQPRIVTMNKVPAEIKQTLQVPITQQIITPQGPPVVTFQFVDVILGLKVTPQITFKGDVILEVEVNRDFAGAQNADGSREVNKRSAKSTVMVKNGKTAVIGGIYQLDDGNIDSGIPVLKDIPLLGNLFKSNRVEKIKNELLLFLKPKILREVDGPMVTKAARANYDAFQELKADDGKVQNSLDAPMEEESSMEFEGESDFELEDGGGFEDELESLSL